MKSHPKTFGLISLFLIVVLALIINSCRKDTHQLSSQNSNSTISAIAVDIPALKAIYQQSVGNKGIKVNGSGWEGLDLIGTLDVNWNTYTLQKRRDSSVIAEFDMNNDTNRFDLKQLNIGDTVDYINKTTAVFIKYKDGSRLNFFTKIIQDLSDSGSQSVIDKIHYNEVPFGFSGLILYYSLDQQYINGYHFTNGATDGVITFPPPGQQTQSVTSVKTNTVQTTCITYTIWETDCTYGGTPSNPYQVLQGCQDTYKGSYTVCSSTDDGGGAVSGDIGGGGTGTGGNNNSPKPPANPCNTSASNTVSSASVSNGHLVIDVAQNPPTGGTGSGTTTTPCNNGTTSSDFIFTCPDNFSFVSVTSSNLWQEGVLTDIHCHLFVLDSFNGQVTNERYVTIQQVHFGLAYFNINGALVFTQNQAKAIAADAFNQAEVDMRKKYASSPNLQSSQLADFWLTRMNYYMGTMTNNRGSAGRTGAINPTNTPPSKAYNPCN